VLENPGWYTAYTPYQAEIAQGRLEALLNFQTMVVELTGMEIANASLLDESTAAGEAMSLLFAVRERDQKKAGINKFFVSENILPQTLSLLQTRANPIGIELDANGNRALRMALQTREQHIKRDKATSNICTAQVLLAVMASMYAVYHGPKGLKFIANKVHNKTAALAKALKSLGYEQINTSYFDTLQIKTKAKQIKKVASEKKVNLFYPDKKTVTISINETTSIRDINYLISIFAEAAKKDTIIITNIEETNAISEALQRQSDFLSEPVFNTYHSETELMRYIKSLERKDLALNHSMIALGSCTMKLNAASEMLPLSWFKWGNIHPFAPLKQAKGYLTMLKELEDQLTEITGFAATSLQPNSGAQGELAGLMVIKAYHESRNDHHRNICLIPSSAHGTNPASAVMAGMKVVVTKSTAECAGWSYQPRKYWRRRMPPEPT